MVENASSRRAFLRSLSALVLPVALLAQQPRPSRPDPWPEISPSDPPMPNPRRLLQAKQKALKAESERLLKLAQEIQQDLEKNDTADILPLKLLRKAEEVEKIGKKMQSLLRD